MVYPKFTPDEVHDVLFPGEADDLYGYIDNAGQVVIQSKFVNTRDFFEGMAEVTSDDDDLSIQRWATLTKLAKW